MVASVSVAMQESVDVHLSKPMICDLQLRTWVHFHLISLTKLIKTHNSESRGQKKHSSLQQIINSG